MYRYPVVTAFLVKFFLFFSSEKHAHMGLAKCKRGNYRTLGFYICIEVTLATRALTSIFMRLSHI